MMKIESNQYFSFIELNNSKETVVMKMGYKVLIHGYEKKIRVLAIYLPINAAQDPRSRE